MPTLVKKGQKPNSVIWKMQAEKQKEESQNKNDKNQELAEKWDVNMKHLIENAHVMERVHTLTSVLAGVISGLFNTNLYSGLFTYVGFHLLMTMLLVVQLDKIENYFSKWTDLLGGLASGIMVFLCGWIIVYNLVYTL